MDSKQIKLEFQKLIFNFLEYYHSNAKICSSCHYSCAKCTAGSANNQCTDCNVITGQRMALSGGKCNCVAGIKLISSN
jgi:hypothetical protein